MPHIHFLVTIPLFSYHTTLDFDRLPIEECIRRFLIGRNKDALECALRHAHLLRRFRLIHFLKILQTQRLHFIQREDDLLQIVQRNSAWFVVKRFRFRADAPWLEGTYHIHSLPEHEPSGLENEKDADGDH